MLDHSCQVQRAALSERRGDCYDTPLVAVHALQRVERLRATDLNNRGCYDSHFGVDFLLPSNKPIIADAIITNPPFALAEQFVAKAIERASLVIMLLRLAFIESERRSHILDTGTLARIHVFSKRLPMMHRAGWEGRKANSGMAFAWFVWDRTHSGPATIDRIKWEAAE